MSSPELLISWLTATVALLGAIAAIIKAFRTPPGERADLAKKYMEMAEHQATQIVGLKTQLDEQDTVIEQMKQELDCIKQAMAEYQHGIEVLIHQIKANGLTPAWEPKGKET